MLKTLKRTCIHNITVDELFSKHRKTVDVPCSTPNTIVSELLWKPFLSRDQDSQMKIILDGKPRPFIELFNAKEKKLFSKDVVMSIYNRIPWLTACPKRNKLFCWPCVLFEKPGLGNYRGVSNLSYVIEEKLQHERTVNHMAAALELEKFISITKVSENSPLNENENKEIKKLLIDVCCVAINQQLLNEHGDISNLLDRERCLKIIAFLQNYDSHKYLSEQVISVITTSPEIVSKVAYALSEVVKLAISKEIKSSKYVSLILNRHSNKCKSQISTILRYALNGTVYERFIGFDKLDNLTAVSVLEHISNTLKKYQISEKICAVSLDGSVLQSCDLVTFLAKMKISLPYCIFVPWYSLQLNYVLQQCLSSFSANCGLFFKIMSSMHAYFQENSKSFTNFMYECNSPLLFIYNSNTGLFSEYIDNKCASVEFIHVVKIHRKSFIYFLDSVINNCKKWDADKIAKAVGFQKYCQKLETVFLLEVFDRIFEKTSCINDLLKGGNYECCKRSSVLKLSDSLIRLKEERFSELLDCVKEEIADQTNTVELCNEKENEYFSLFGTIIRNVVDALKSRWKHFNELECCLIFDFEKKVGIRLKKAKLCTLSLKHKLNIEINEKQVHNELRILWNHDAFSKKSLHELYKYLCEMHLSHTFKTLIDISELILTMPFKPALDISYPSKLHTIEKWFDNTGHVYEDGDLSILCVESSVFQNIMQSSAFYDQTLSIFQSKFHFLKDIGL